MRGETTVRYLRLRGRLYADNLLVFRPGYLSSGPYREEIDVSRLLIVEVTSMDGELVLRAPLATAPYAEWPDAVRVRGSIPLPDSAARLTILRRDDSGQAFLIHTIEVPREAPEIRFLDTPVEAANGRIEIRWEARGDPPPVEFRLQFSWDNGDTWIPAVEGRLTEMAAEVDFDLLPGGERCRLAVDATSGVRSSRAISEPFAVREKPCHAFIHSPLDGDTIQMGEIALIGNGWWLEGMYPETELLRWESDRDGLLGRGTAVSARLSTGEHVVTLVAGEGDREGTDSVRVTATDESRVER